MVFCQARRRIRTELLHTFHNEASNLMQKKYLTRETVMYLIRRDSIQNEKEKPLKKVTDQTNLVMELVELV